MTLISYPINFHLGYRKLLDLSHPKVMGILNITPDSFYSGSRFFTNPQELIDKTGEMIENGASILDIGGYSTRPNAKDISTSEELDRILPVIEIILKKFPETIISVDTFRAEVARQSVLAGASMINDIGGGNLDEQMFQTIAELQVPYILMHSRGNPQTMGALNQYQQLSIDIIRELQEKIFYLKALGVQDIIIDPGFGFAKNLEQNYQLMQQLHHLNILDLPLLVGISRKSMIWKALNTDASKALNGTTALNMVALQKGAKILRVHDVKEASETIKIFNLLTNQESF